MQDVRGKVESLGCGMSDATCLGCGAAATVRADTPLRVLRFCLTCAEKVGLRLNLEIRRVKEAA